MLPVTSRKVGFLKWEADVERGSTTFTFTAMTRSGAIKKAMSFYTELGSRKGRLNG